MQVCTDAISPIILVIFSFQVVLFQVVSERSQLMLFNLFKFESGIGTKQMIFDFPLCMLDVCFDIHTGKARVVCCGCAISMRANELDQGFLISA